MRMLRPLTLVWPGLPWLWLRGSAAGLVLALAFAVVLDMAILSTWIWSEFLELPIVIGLWVAAAVIWMAATVSAALAFPAPLQTGHDAAADALFTAARVECDDQAQRRTTAAPADAPATRPPTTSLTAPAVIVPAPMPEDRT